MQFQRKFLWLVIHTHGPQDCSQEKAGTLHHNCTPFFPLGGKLGEKKSRDKSLDPVSGVRCQMFPRVEEIHRTSRWRPAFCFRTPILSCVYQSRTGCRKQSASEVITLKYNYKQRLNCNEPKSRSKLKKPFPVKFLSWPSGAFDRFLTRLFFRLLPLFSLTRNVLLYSSFSKLGDTFNSFKVETFIRAISTCSLPVSRPWISVRRNLCLSPTLP